MRVEKTVIIDGRRFTVKFDEHGEPVIITERKIHAPGEPWECVCNKPYWHARHHRVGKPGSLVARIIADASVKS